MRKTGDVDEQISDVAQRGEGPLCWFAANVRTGIGLGDASERDHRPLAAICLLFSLISLSPNSHLSPQLPPNLRQKDTSLPASIVQVSEPYDGQMVHDRDH